jgi:hypothetical protein
MRSISCRLVSSSCRAKHPALPPGLRGGIRGACARRRALPRGERRPAALPAWSIGCRCSTAGSRRSSVAVMYESSVKSSSVAVMYGSQAIRLPRSPTEIVTRYPQSADYHLGARVMSLQLCLTRLRSRSSGMGRLSTVARPKIRVRWRWGGGSVRFSLWLYVWV